MFLCVSRIWLSLFIRPFAGLETASGAHNVRNVRRKSKPNDNLIGIRCIIIINSRWYTRENVCCWPFRSENVVLRSTLSIVAIEKTPDNSRRSYHLVLRSTLSTVVIEKISDNYRRSYPSRVITALGLCTQINSILPLGSGMLYNDVLLPTTLLNPIVTSVSLINSADPQTYISKRGASP